jgi:hypothetical protein
LVNRGGVDLKILRVYGAVTHGGEKIHDVFMGD